MYYVNKPPEALICDSGGLLSPVFRFTDSSAPRDDPVFSSSYFFSSAVRASRLSSLMPAFARRFLAAVA